jgi:hypothetical protein
MSKLSFTFGLLAGWSALIPVGVVHAMLVNRVTTQRIIAQMPTPQITVVSKPQVFASGANKVVRLYDSSGHPIREFVGHFGKITPEQGALQFTLENGRTVILGGSFSVEEIPGDL